MTLKLQEDLLRPFATAAQLSLALAVAKRMADYGVSAAELVELAQKEMEDRAKERGLTAPQEGVGGEPSGQRCLECDSPIILMRVNATSCTQVGGDWTHMESCVNPGCTYTRLLKEGSDGL